MHGGWWWSVHSLHLKTTSSDVSPIYRALAGVYKFRVNWFTRKGLVKNKKNLEARRELNFFLFFTRPFSGKLNYLKHSPRVLAPVHFQIELAWSRLPPPCFTPTPIGRTPAALIKPQMCLTRFSSGGDVLYTVAGGGRFTPDMPLDDGNATRAVLRHLEFTDSMKQIQRFCC